MGPLKIPDNDVGKYLAGYKTETQICKYCLMLADEIFASSITENVPKKKGNLF